VANVYRYVNADSVGGDGTTDALIGANAAYATLAAWQTAEATDLVTAGDVHTVVLGGSTDLTTVFTLSSTAGWTTSAANRIIMMRAPDATMGVVVQASWTSILLCQIAHVTFFNLYVENTTTSAFQPGVIHCNGGDMVIDSCVAIANVKSNNTCYHLQLPANSTVHFVRNVGAGAAVGLNAHTELI